MGCCAGGFVDGAMENAWAQKAQWAATTCEEPRKLTTGGTLIPMNFINGEFCNVYPSWFDNQSLKSNWNQLLQQLNAVSIPACQKLKEASLSTINKDGMGGQTREKAKQRMYNAQATQMKIQTDLTREMDNILSQWNKKVFKKCKLKAVSELTQLSMMQNYGRRYKPTGNDIPNLGIIISNK